MPIDTIRLLRRGITVTVLGVLGWIAGCSDTPGGPGCCDPRPLEGLVVSDPSPAPGLSGSASGLVVEHGAADSIVWVSLPPGTVPMGARAVIRRVGDDSPLTTLVLEGGFDPVPVAAVAGDSIDVVVLDGGGTPVYEQRVAVRPRRPPIVVRTDPPPDRTDVPVNASIVIVFSEPIDPSTLTLSSVQLLRGTNGVSGAVSLLGGTATSASFVPAARLDPNTTYQLVVTEAVRDLDGDSLEARVTVAFTTGLRATDVASVTVTPDTAFVSGTTVSRDPGTGLSYFTATGKDAAGNPVSGFTITWTSSDPQLAQVDSAGLVRGLAPGVVRITATIEGKQGSAVVTVLAAWPAIDIQPGGLLTLAEGERAGFVASVSNPVPGFRLSWWASPLVSLMAAGNTATITAVATGEGSVGVGLSAPGAALMTTANVPIRVAQSGAASVTVEPGTVQMAPVSGYVPLRATVRDASGNELRHVPVTWSVSNSGGYFNTGYTFYPGGPNFDHVVQVGGVVGSHTFTATAGEHSETATVEIDYVRFASVAVGYDGGRGNVRDFCGLTPVGVAYCYGENSISFDGFLTSNASGLVAVPGGPTFAAVTTGSWFACGLTPAGAALCWGFNHWGVLGTDSTIGLCNTELNEAMSCSPTPVPVAGGHIFTQISAGSRHACGRTMSGSAYCWGLNGGGELGDGTTTTRSTPVAVAGGLAFTQISAGAYHTCGLTPSGAVYCWGDGYYGNGYGPTPVAIAGGLVFSQIDKNCGLTTAGAAYCWSPAIAPGPIAEGLSFVQFGVSDDHTCGLTPDGTLYCDGWTYSGTGPDPDVYVPHRIIGGAARFTSINSNGVRTCAIATNGLAYCYESDWNGMYEIAGQR